MGLLNKLFRNARKPEGMLGRMMVNGMNGGSHARLAEWGLDGIDIQPDARVLEIGCGGGANIARLLQRCPKGMVQGIDYSAVSVAKSRKVNAQAINQGRCAVQQNNVTDLIADTTSFADGSYSLVTAFETVYFWPNIDECFRAVRRVLRDGGQFLIVNEADGTGDDSAKWEHLVGDMHTYTEAELHKLLTNAGFSNIVISHDTQRGWLKAIAVK